MADPITQAFVDTLRGDPTLQGLLASYKGVAAVFTTGTIPEDAQLPFIVTDGEVSHEPFDTKTSQGHDFIRDISCHADDKGSPIQVETIANRVRALFHRQNIPVTGFGTMISVVTGPISNDGDRVYGRVLSVRMVLSGG